MRGAIPYSAVRGTVLFILGMLVTAMTGTLPQSIFGKLSVVFALAVGCMGFSLGARLQASAMPQKLAVKSVLVMGVCPWVFTGAEHFNAVLLAMGIGLLAGAVTTLALRESDHGQEWTVLLGGVAVSSGAATMAGLSPVAVCCISGIVTARYAAAVARRQMMARLSASDRLLYWLAVPACGALCKVAAWDSAVMLAAIILGLTLFNANAGYKAGKCPSFN